MIYGLEKGRQGSNVHKVHKEFWAELSPRARLLFNHLYATILDHRELNAHTKFPWRFVPKSMWRVTAWNIAWQAAAAVDAIDRQTLRDRRPKVRNKSLDNG